MADQQARKTTDTPKSLNEEGGSFGLTAAHGGSGLATLTGAFYAAASGHLIAAGALAVAGLALCANTAFSTWFTQDDNYATVTARFGQKMGNITGGGIKYKKPWPHRSIRERVPVFTQSLPGELTDLQTHDNVTVKSVKYNLLFRIVDPATYAFSAKNRLDQMSEIAANSVRAQIGNSIAIKTEMHTDGNDGSHTSRFFDLKSDRQRMATQIMAEVNTRLRDEYGMEIVDVPMEQPVLDSRFTEAVAKRILAEQEGLAEEARMTARGRGISGERDAAIEGLIPVAQKLFDAKLVKSLDEALDFIKFQMEKEAQIKTNGVVILNAAGPGSQTQSDFIAAALGANSLIGQVAAPAAAPSAVTGAATPAPQA